MAIDPERLLALDIPVVEQRYDEKDCILYALGCGLGHDPLDREALRFVYEKNLAVLPTYGSVLAASSFWMRDLETGIDFTKVVHGAQSLTVLQALPVRGTVMGRTRVRDVVDKGAGRGALLYVEHAVFEKDTGTALCTSLQTIVCRGDGGFGGPDRATRIAQEAAVEAPGRPADIVCNLPTRPDMALLYRLSGDLNPLHADPDVAARAGFPRPILHGLATFAVAGHAILKTLCGYDPAKLKTIAGRFTAPVFPGDTIRTEIWRDGGEINFRTRVVERNLVVMDQGRATIA
jgi:acyl dehydratase